MSSSPPALAPAFSTYLDLLRFLAALAVVAAHYAMFGVIETGAGGAFASLGREAVILFFVLSGFVIAASVARGRPSVRDYAEARLSRLYSVTVPVLLLAFAAAALLRWFAGIEAPRSYALDKIWLYLPFHLLFLGQHWHFAEVPPFMVPYWSLCYEAWYYLLFGLAFYLRGRRRAVCVGLALAYMGYKMWLLLPVWLAGVWLYRRRAGLLSPGLARAGCCASVLLFAAYVALDLEAALRGFALAWWPFPALPLGSADRFLADYLVCALVLLHFACARDARLDVLLRFAPPIRTLAAYTFTLYLSHVLVIGLWLLLYPHQRGSLADLVLLSVVIAATTFALGAVTERRRHAWRPLFARLLGTRAPVRTAQEVTDEPRAG
jgi:peptidoglycan/LPS O-acetylase OafA/YrhL